MEGKESKLVLISKRIIEVRRAIRKLEEFVEKIEGEESKIKLPEPEGADIPLNLRDFLTGYSEDLAFTADRIFKAVSKLDEMLF